VVIDEAYVEIAQGTVGDSLAFVRQGRPVIVCRTFSKAYGLAGLRMGYALAPAPLVDALNRSRQPFNCNLVAQAAAIAALDDHAFIEEYNDLCRESKAYFEGFCDTNGLDIIPSGGNFMLIRVGDGRHVFEQLQTQGLIVRPMDGYGLGEYVRVSYGLMDENKRCAEALARTCGQ
jgi:histidinol-phosphate aminotransferase